MGISDNMSNNLEKHRKKLGMSLSEFADWLCISRSSLQEYSRGAGNPTVATIEHLAGKLGITVEQFVLAAEEQDEQA